MLHSSVSCCFESRGAPGNGGATSLRPVDVARDEPSASGRKHDGGRGPPAGGGENGRDRDEMRG
jgi:hypothetical protein